MEEDFEDGEICDEKTVSTGSSVGPNAAHLGGGGEGAVLSRLPFGASMAARPVAQRLRRSSSSSESEGEVGKDDGSDDDDYGRAVVPPKRPAAEAVASQASCSSAGTSKPRKKNNIWGTVLQEQALSHEMGSWAGMEKKVESDRNVESYDYIRAQKMKAQLELEGNAAGNFQAPDLLENVVDVSPNLDDIETFGTGPTRSSSCRKGKSAADDEPIEEEVGADGDSIVVRTDRKMWRKRTHDNRYQAPAAMATNEGKGSVKSRLGRRSFDKNKDRSHVRVTESNTEEEVARELMRILGEHEDVFDTFKRLVETAGREEALNLLYITEDLQASGGVMTVDGSRRRTFGGVYLFLAKTELPKEMTNVIFEQQKQKGRQTWRDKRQMYPYNAARAQNNFSRFNKNNSSNGSAEDLLASDLNEAIHGSTEAIYGSSEAIHGLDETTNGHSQTLGATVTTLDSTQTNGSTQTVRDCTVGSTQASSVLGCENSCSKKEELEDGEIMDEDSMDAAGERDAGGGTEVRGGEEEGNKVEEGLLDDSDDIGIAVDFM